MNLPSALPRGLPDVEESMCALTVMKGNPSMIFSKSTSLLSHFQLRKCHVDNFSSSSNNLKSFLINLIKLN